jgi:hypothetical protein
MDNVFGGFALGFLESLRVTRDGDSTPKLAHTGTSQLSDCRIWRQKRNNKVAVFPMHRGVIDAACKLCSSKTLAVMLAFTSFVHVEPHFLFVHQHI